MNLFIYLFNRESLYPRIILSKATAKVDTRKSVLKPQGVRETLYPGHFLPYATCVSLGAFIRWGFYPLGLLSVGLFSAGLLSVGLLSARILSTPHTEAAAASPTQPPALAIASPIHSPTHSNTYTPPASSCQAQTILIDNITTKHTRAEIEIKLRRQFAGVRCALSFLKRGGLALVLETPK